MAVTEIPKEQWSEFLEEFGRRHQGWLVQIEERHVQAPQASRRMASSAERFSPLAAITVQLAGKGKDRALSIVTRHQGATPSTTMHSIQHPCTVRVEEHDHGKEKRLVLTTEDGRTTVVRLHQVIPPAAWTSDKAQQSEP